MRALRAPACPHRVRPVAEDLRLKLLRPRRTKRISTDTDCPQAVRPGPGPALTALAIPNSPALGPSSAETTTMPPARDQAA